MRLSPKVWVWLLLGSTLLIQGLLEREKTKGWWLMEWVSECKQRSGEDIGGGGKAGRTGQQRTGADYSVSLPGLRGTLGHEEATWVPEGGREREGIIRILEVTEGGRERRRSGEMRCSAGDWRDRRRPVVCAQLFERERERERGRENNDAGEGRKG